MALKRAVWYSEVVWGVLRYSVLRHEAVVVEDSLDPPRHGGGERAKILGRHLSNPDRFDLVDHVGHAGGELVAQLVLHDVPGIVDGVQVRGVARPDDCLDGVVPEPVPDQVSSVAVEEPLTAVAPHEPQQVLVQHIPVPHHVHGDPSGQEEEASLAPGPRERSPDHDAGRVLDGGRAELGIEPLTDWSPDQLDPVPDQLEGGLVREHHLAPVLLGPVAIPSTEVEPGLHHPLGQQRLLGSPAARHAQSLLAAVADGPQGDVRFPDQPAARLDVGGSREGIVPDKHAECLQNLWTSTQWDVPKLSAS